LLPPPLLPPLRCHCCRHAALPLPLLPLLPLLLLPLPLLPLPMLLPTRCAATVAAASVAVIVKSSSTSVPIASQGERKTYLFSKCELKNNGKKIEQVSLSQGERERNLVREKIFLCWPNDNTTPCGEVIFFCHTRELWILDHFFCHARDQLMLTAAELTGVIYAEALHMRGARIFCIVVCPVFCLSTLL
jgi:hypothetical protein